MVHEDAISALLFDLGGVVIEIDFDRMLRQWLPHSALQLDQMRDRLRPDLPYQLHECGELDARTYMAHLAKVFELKTDTDTVAAGWNAMLVDQIDATLDLIDRVSHRLPCHAFSNTSAIHREVWSTRFPRVTDAFERLFLSFELGVRKPDPAAFEAVADRLGIAPDRILFFDDTVENVAGARAAGLQAVHVRSPRDVEQALDRLGVARPD